MEKEQIEKELKELIGEVMPEIEDVDFNAFVITHSPFVLSDIPNGQILYLEEGHRDPEKEEKKTFAGNIPQFFAAFSRGRKLSKNEIDEIQKMIDEYKES